MKNISLFLNGGNYSGMLTKSLSGWFGNHVVESHPLPRDAKSLYTLWEKKRSSALVFDYFESKEIFEELHGLLARNPGPLPLFIALLPEVLNHDMGRRLLKQDFLFFHYSFEIKDIYYLLRSFLSPETTKFEEAAKGFYSEKLKLEEVLFLRRLGRKGGEFETNQSFLPGSMSLEIPVLNNTFLSNRHRLTECAPCGVDSHFRGKCSFTYERLTKPLGKAVFAKLEKEWEFDAAQTVANPEVVAAFEAAEVKKKLVLAVDKKKGDPEDEKGASDNPEVARHKRLELLSKTLFNDYLRKHGKPVEDQEIRITVYDHNLDMLGAPSRKMRAENIRVFSRVLGSDPSEEVCRDRPDLVVFNFESPTIDFQFVKSLIASFTQFRDYFPFVLLFNHTYKDSIEQLRDDFEYHFIVSTKAPLNSEFIYKMAQMYRKKKAQAEMARLARVQKKAGNKDYQALLVDPEIFQDYRLEFPLDNDRYWMPFVRDAELVWMSEFEVVFICDRKLREGDVFRLANFPRPIHAVVAPHIPGSKEEGLSDCYRAVFFGLQEQDKMSLRKFVNIIAKQTGKEGSLSPEMIAQLKQRHLSKIG